MMSLCGEEMSCITHSNRLVTTWTSRVNNDTTHKHMHTVCTQDLILDLFSWVTDTLLKLALTELWDGFFWCVCANANLRLCICALIVYYIFCFCQETYDNDWTWQERLAWRKGWWGSESQRRFTQEGKKDGDEQQWRATVTSGQS